MAEILSSDYLQVLYCFSWLLIVSILLTDTIFLFFYHMLSYSCGEYERFHRILAGSCYLLYPPQIDWFI